ncbi:MAG: hypothetical protein V3V41_06540 [Candidatus Heimdallarchaeota archaeon]
MSKIEEKKWTIEEGIQEANNRENGISDYSRDDNDYKKIGDIRKCHKCKKPVDVLAHTLFDMDVMSITYCEECDEHETRLEDMSDEKWIEKGKVIFDGKKYKKESKILHDMVITIREAIKEIKPVNDSILEYDRTREIIEHGKYAHGKPSHGDFELWMFREFVDYLALNGKLTLTKH